MLGIGLGVTLVPSSDFFLKNAANSGIVRLALCSRYHRQKWRHENERNYADFHPHSLPINLKTRSVCRNSPKTSTHPPNLLKRESPRTAWVVCAACQSFS